jgi:hypothetical protein
MMIEDVPNYRAGVDAGRALLFAFERRRPGTTHRDRSISLHWLHFLLFQDSILACPAEPEL